MAYLGSTAYQLDPSRQAWEAPARRQLEVHEGGRRAARSREASAPSHVAVVVAAIVLSVFLAVLGLARVALTVQNVVLLQDLNVAESTVEQAYDMRTELQIERSALTSADRIQRIATQNYGMVYGTDVESITIPVAEASADEASPEA